MDIRWHVVTEFSQSCRETVEARINKLAGGQKDLIHVVIHVEGSKHHQHGAAEAKIRCQAKGRELIAHERDEEPEIALMRAVDAFEREVRSMRSKRRNHRGSGRTRAVEEDVDGSGDDSDTDKDALISEGMD
jgi:ribosome-associated translation inhibitor RaiA